MQAGLTCPGHGDDAASFPGDDPAALRERAGEGGAQAAREVIAALAPVQAGPQQRPGPLLEPAHVDAEALDGPFPGERGRRESASGGEHVMSGLPLVGDEFAGYLVRAVLGRGGMSVVY